MPKELVVFKITSLPALQDRFVSFCTVQNDTHPTVQTYFLSVVLGTNILARFSRTWSMMP